MLNISCSGYSSVFSDCGLVFWATQHIQQSVYPNLGIYDRNGAFRAFLLIEGNGVIQKVVYSKRTILLESTILVVSVSLLYHLGIGRGNYLLYSWICLPIFMVMIPGLAGTSFPKLQDSRLLFYASEISYAFFLAQLLLYPIMRKWFAFSGIDNNLFKIVSSFICCSCMAIGLHEIIEKPCKKVLKSLLHI